MRTITITPNQNALAEMAEHIWAIAKASKTRPLVILPTAGPNASLPQALERLRNEADKSGDFTRVIAYKAKLKAQVHTK